MKSAPIWDMTWFYNICVSFTYLHVPVFVRLQTSHGASIRNWLWSPVVYLTSGFAGHCPASFVIANHNVFCPIPLQWIRVCQASVNLIISMDLGSWLGHRRSQSLLARLSNHATYYRVTHRCYPNGASKGDSIIWGTTQIKYGWDIYIEDCRQSVPASSLQDILRLLVGFRWNIVYKKRPRNNKPSVHLTLIGQSQRSTLLQICDESSYDTPRENI